MNPVIDRLKNTFKNVTQFAKNLVGQDISDAENDERLQAEIAANSALQEAMDEVMGYETNLNPKPKKNLKKQTEKGNSPRTYEPKTRARGKIEREKER